MGLYFSTQLTQDWTLLQTISGAEQWNSDIDLEEKVLAEGGKGEIILELQAGANYIGLIGEGY